MSTSDFCPNCGHAKAFAEAAFCMDCGYKFQKRASTPITTELPHLDEVTISSALEKKYTGMPLERPVDRVSATDHPSKGRSLGAIAGTVITMAFFLPWFSACNTVVTGYDLAVDRMGTIDNSWIYWLPLLGGITCIALFFLMKPHTVSDLARAAWIRLIAGIVGFFPITNIWLNVFREPNAPIEILQGFWLVSIGYIAIFTSFFIDRKKSDAGGRK